MAYHLLKQLRESKDVDLFVILLNHGKLAGEVEKLENFTAQGKKIRTTAIARTIKRDGNYLLNRAGPLRQDDDAVAHVNGFVDVVSNEEHGSAPVLPKAQNFILHTHARKGV